MPGLPPGCFGWDLLEDCPTRHCHKAPLWLLLDSSRGPARTEAQLGEVQTVLCSLQPLLLLLLWQHWGNSSVSMRSSKGSAASTGSGWILHTGCKKFKLFHACNPSLCILFIYFIVNNVFSQLFTNSCRSWFSVLPCLNIRRGHHIFLTDFPPGLSVTLCVKASFDKKWQHKWAAQRWFYQSILHIPRGNNHMLFHWDSVEENHSQKINRADWTLAKAPCACACHTVEVLPSE